MLDQVISITGVAKKYWTAFSVVSPRGVPFEGWVCQQESDKLGMLAVTRVEGQERLEFIYAMPKIPYPYLREAEGARLVIPVPMNATDARFNVKLDGTAIIWYPLRDAQGNVEVIPRTRLNPVLAASKWGDWPALLKEAWPDPSPIARAVLEHNVVLAFELWGYRNPHLVSYQTPLALTLHSGIQHKRLIAYHRLAHIAKTYNLPLVESVALGALDADALARAYRELQDKMEARNRAAGQDTYVAEGAVLVISTSETAEYYKCKPASIEEVHFAQGRGLSKEIVTQTILKMAENAYNFDGGRVEDLEAELEKDWERPVIEGQADLIRRVWLDYLVEQQKRAWLKHLVDEAGLPTSDLPNLMRYLSKHYSRGEMSWVYNSVKQMYP